jgi:hypothetical protein
MTGRRGARFQKTVAMIATFTKVVPAVVTAVCASVRTCSMRMLPDGWSGLAMGLHLPPVQFCTLAVKI